MFRTWLRENPTLVPLFLVILTSLLLISQYNYLLFHVVVELFCILVASAVFIIAWNARWRTGNHFLLVLGTGFACSACLDLLYTLAYPGMSVFANTNEGIAEQFWLVARSLEAGAFLLSPFFLNRRIKPWILLLNNAGIAGLLAALIFLGLFPLTSPARLAEAMILLALLASFLLLQTRGTTLDTPVRVMIQTAIVLTMAEETLLFFISFAPGFIMTTGYFLKLLACFFVYKAVLETGLREPQRVLFMELERGRRLLADAESRFRSISEGAPVGIFRSTPDGRFEYANPRLAEMYGYDSPTQLMNAITNIGVQLHVDQARYATMKKQLEESALLTGFQAQIRCKDGTTIWTSRDIRAHRDMRGNLTHFDGFVTDISASKQLEAMQRDVDRVLRHDLKSPLISITSGLAVVRATSRPDHRGEIMLHEMERSAMQMLALIDLSAGLYKMEKGNYDLDLEKLNLMDVLQETINEHSSLAEKKKLAVQLLLNGETPAKTSPVSIMADPALCHVALSNLLLNALEATPEDATVALEVCSTPLSLTIRNQGEVPEQIRDHFFEKYATCGKENGTGLGTYSARLIATTHGWTMAMHTGNGTTSVSINFSAQL